MDAFADFNVVINDEEQYSIWPTALEIPSGWTATGFSGSKDECIAHIDTVWSDIRPRSLRLALDS